MGRTGRAPRTAPPADADVEQWLPLVRHVAVRLAASLPAHVDADDLIGYGFLGLLDAMAKFDPSRGVKFETYAYLRIRGAMLDGLRSMDWAPATLRRDQAALEEAEARLASEMGRRPTDRELAAAVGMRVEDVARIRADADRAGLMSLDEPWSDNDGQEDTYALADIVGDSTADPASADIQPDDRQRLERALAELSEPEWVCVLGLYSGWTPREVAAALGLSVSRVSQLHAQAIARLRRSMGVRRRRLEPRAWDPPRLRMAAARRMRRAG
jgi:RNA polymerase sigma factor for flagellar operon FliA